MTPDFSVHPLVRQIRDHLSAMFDLAVEYHRKEGKMPPRLYTRGASKEEVNMVVVAAIEEWGPWPHKNKLIRDILLQEETDNMATVKLVRYIFKFADDINTATALKTLTAAGVRDAQHFASLGVYDGYYKNRKRKDLESLKGVTAASANIPNLEDASEDVEVSE